MFSTPVPITMFFSRLCFQLVLCSWLWRSLWSFHLLENIPAWPSVPGCTEGSTPSSGKAHSCRYSYSCFWEDYLTDFVGFSNEHPADPKMRYFSEVLLDKPGFGTRCMVEEPLEWVYLAGSWILLLFVSLQCLFLYFGRDFPCNNITTEWEMPLVSPALIDMLAGPDWDSLRPSPDCQCSTSKKLTMLPECPEGAGGLPPPQVTFSFSDRVTYFWKHYSSSEMCTVCFVLQRIQSTGDVLLDLTGRNISDYLVKTYPTLIRTRCLG